MSRSLIAPEGGKPRFKEFFRKARKADKLQVVVGAHYVSLPPSNEECRDKTNHGRQLKCAGDHKLDNLSKRSRSSVTPDSAGHFVLTTNLIKPVNRVAVGNVHFVSKSCGSRDWSFMSFFYDLVDKYRDNRVT